jgi:hypothetical protein
MLKDNMLVCGKLKLELRDEATGELKQVNEVDNLVVNAGLAWLTDRMIQNTASIMDYIAIGPTNTAPAAAQTTLSGAELARVQCTTHNRTTVTATNDSVAYVSTFAAGTGTGTIEEAGIFNAASTGTMLSRALTGTITKGAGDSLTITWTVTLAD